MGIGVSSVIDRVDYSEYSTSQLLLVPLSLIGLSLTVLALFFMFTGSPVVLGVDFVGGVELRVTPDSGETGQEAVLQSETFAVEPDSVQSVPADNDYIVTFRGDSIAIADAEEQAEANGFTIESSSEISESFGADSQQLALWGLVVAFAGMAVVVFALFRSVIPSVTVVASAFSVIIVPVAIMTVFGIELTFGTIAALLMLLGYSVDSDMLLNEYIIKRRGGFYSSVYEAMDTGLTMTLTSLLAMSVLAVASAVIGIQVLRDIGFIIALGLTVDILNTYLMNVSILRWYKLERGDTA